MIPKLSVATIALNEEEYIGYFLKSVYPFAHEILITEGRVSKYPAHASKLNGSSIDNTLQIINDFDDPEGKISLVSGNWKEKRHMWNACLKRYTGTHLLVMGADEVITPEDINRMIQLIRDKPDKYIYGKFKILTFWQNFQTVMRDYGVSRYINKCESNYQMISDNLLGDPRIAIDPRKGKYSQSIALIDGICVYNYGYVKKKSNIDDKIAYFNNIGRGTWRKDYYNKNWIEKNCIEFKKHPCIMQQHPYYNKPPIGNSMNH